MCAILASSPLSDTEMETFPFPLKVMLAALAALTPLAGSVCLVGWLAGREEENFRISFNASLLLPPARLSTLKYE